MVTLLHFFTAIRVAVRVAIGTVLAVAWRSAFTRPRRSTASMAIATRWRTLGAAVLRRSWTACVRPSGRRRARYTLWWSAFALRRLCARLRVRLRTGALVYWRPRSVALGWRATVALRMPRVLASRRTPWVAGTSWMTARAASEINTN